MKDRSALPILEVLDDSEEIDRRYAEFERQEAQKERAATAEAERLKQVAKDKERRPFDPAIAAELCEQIAEGGALKAVCRLAAWEDDILLLADDTSKDRVEKARDKGLETDSGAVARSKLQIEARKALLRANNPTTWGEAIQVLNPEQEDPFAGISLERIEEAARAAELEEIVEEKTGARPGERTASGEGRNAARFRLVPRPVQGRRSLTEPKAIRPARKA